MLIMKRAFLLTILYSLQIYSCKPEKAYFFSRGLYVGKIKCNNDSLMVFSYAPNHPERAGFIESDTLNINGVLYNNVFLFYKSDQYDKIFSEELKVGDYYLITGRNDLVRKDFICINRKKLLMYENVLKIEL